MTGGVIYAAAVIGAAAVVTFGWRALGVYLADRIAPDGRVFEWVACVAYALLAALIGRMIVLPTGPLADTVLVDRLVSVGLALGIFYATRQNLLASLVPSCGLLVLLTWARSSIF